MATSNKRSARTIKVTKEVKAKLAKLFNCTERTVLKALCFEDKPESQLCRKIRYVARMDYGGWIEAAVPEEEIFYDTTEEGARLMRQYFNNGAVLEVSMTTGVGVVWFKGVPKNHYDEVYMTEIPAIQNYAKSLR